MSFCIHRLNNNILPPKLLWQNQYDSPADNASCLGRMKKEAWCKPKKKRHTQIFSMKQKFMDKKAKLFLKPVSPVCLCPLAVRWRTSSPKKKNLGRVSRFTRITTPLTRSFPSRTFKSMREDTLTIVRWADFMADCFLSWLMQLVGAKVH